MSPLSPHKNHRGAPLGNSNGFKHGLYSQRIKKRLPFADDATVLKSLADEIESDLRANHIVKRYSYLFEFPRDEYLPHQAVI